MVEPVAGDWQACRYYGGWMGPSKSPGQFLLSGNRSWREFWANPLEAWNLTGRLLEQAVADTSQWTSGKPHFVSTLRPEEERSKET